MRQQAQVYFGDNMHRSRKHMTGMRFEVVVGKGRMKVGKRFTALPSCEIALKCHQFASCLDGYSVVAMVVVHVAIGAFPSPPNAAGDGGCIEPDLIRQGLQTRMDFLARIKANKQVITASRPFHEDGLGGGPMRVPFIPLEEGYLDRAVRVPWP